MKSEGNQDLVDDMHPTQQSHWRKAFWIPVVIAVLVIIGFGAKRIFLTKVSPVQENAQETTGSTAPLTPDQQKQATHVIGRFSKAGDLNLYYFDRASKALVSHRTVKNRTGFMAGTNSLDGIQISSNGSIYWLADQDPARAEPESPAIISAIYSEDGQLVAGSPSDPTTFLDWKLSKDGKLLFMLYGKSTNGPAKLTVTDLSSKQTRNLATFSTDMEGFSSINLSDDEQTIIVPTSKERVESDYYYNDIYIETVKIGSGAVTEAKIWEDRKPSPFPFWGVSGLVFGPRQRLAVGQYSENQKFTLRTLELATGKTEDVYTIKGSGQVNRNDIAWSPDGMKLLFTVERFGDDRTPAPTDQGILLYDFNTKTVTQLINGASKFITPNTFDGSSFLYHSDSSGDQSLSYFDIGTKESTTVTDIFVTDPKNEPPFSAGAIIAR